MVKNSKKVKKPLSKGKKIALVIFLLRSLRWQGRIKAATKT